MGIIDHLHFQACDEGDPDDYRPDSAWAMAADPETADGPYVKDLTVFVDLVTPGDRVPLHTHPIDEVIVVQQGTAEVQLGDEVRTVSAGAVIFAPAGAAHGGRVLGEESVSFLGVFASATVGTEYLERNPAPGTEGQPPQPPSEIDVRAESTRGEWSAGHQGG